MSTRAIRTRAIGSRAAQTGRAGEDIAERLYLAQGARILARRFRCRGGEIDLIAELAGVLVFVEVKARARIETAAHAVTQAQWRRLENVAARFMLDHAIGPDTPMRFDVVLVGAGGAAEIVENAGQF